MDVAATPDNNGRLWMLGTLGSDTRRGDEQLWLGVVDGSGRELWTTADDRLGKPRSGLITTDPWGHIWVVARGSGETVWTHINPQ